MKNQMALPMIRLSRKTLLAALLLLMPFFADGQAAETVRLVTDRDVYVAGDLILCSAACYSGQGISDQSAIAYVELVSSGGIASTAKIALVSGRGAGYLNIPADTPTGNYRIFAYTALSESAETRNITIYNTFYGNRVPGGVIAVPEDIPLKPKGGVLTPEGITSRRVESGGRITYTLSNTSNEDVCMSVSIYEDDGLEASKAKAEYVSLTPREAEYDGETIYAKVYGPDAVKVTGRPWLTAVIKPALRFFDEITRFFDHIPLPILSCVIRLERISLKEFTQAAVVNASQFLSYPHAITFTRYLCVE